MTDTTPEGPVREAQNRIPKLFTASALREFQSEFRGIYYDHVMQGTFGAVGPIETFLGWLVQTGRIAIRTEAALRTVPGSTRLHPGYRRDYPIRTVLRDLAAQEGCDGEPYDTMVAAADYIAALEAALHPTVPTIANCVIEPGVGIAQTNDKLRLFVEETAMVETPETITRFEYIGPQGRAFSLQGTFTISMQDDGHTLKVFGDTDLNRPAPQQETT